jgi:hypothetical protein
MWWISLALAEEPAEAPAEPTWEIVKETEACSFARGPSAELVASCLWPEVSPARLDALLSDFGGAQDIWQSVASSTITGEPTEAGTPVFHVHSIPGLSDREVLLLWSRVEEDGALRYAWTRPQDQPRVTEGRVNVVRDEGYYLVRSEGEGTALEALFVYEPGGSIPDWILRATQAASADVMLQELRQAATTDKEEPEQALTPPPE